MTNQLYIANLGKYNEGILQGEWFTFPVDMNEVAEVIGLNAQYEEFAIHDYEFDFPMTISESADIEKLNELVEIIEKNSDVVELFQLLQSNEYDTDKIASVAMNVFSELDIQHDIVHDDDIDEMVKHMIENGDGHTRVKYFLSNASNTNEYHMLDGYGNIERLTAKYIENVLSEDIDELKRELGF